MNKQDANLFELEKATGIVNYGTKEDGIKFAKAIISIYDRGMKSPENV